MLQSILYWNKREFISQLLFQVFCQIVNSLKINLVIKHTRLVGFFFFFFVKQKIRFWNTRWPGPQKVQFAKMLQADAIQLPETVEFQDAKG